MPRRAQTPRKAKYAPTLTRTTDRFVVKLMKDGKKGLAERILRQALARAEASAHRPGLEVLETALRNALERAVLLAEGGEILPEHLFPESQSAPKRTVASSERSLRGMERALIEQVLSESGGNRSEAARVLGVNRATLYNKLKAYGLE